MQNIDDRNETAKILSKYLHDSQFSNSIPAEPAPAAAQPAAAQPAAAQPAAAQPAAENLQPITSIKNLEPNKTQLKCTKNGKEQIGKFVKYTEDKTTKEVKIQIKYLNPRNVEIIEGGFEVSQCKIILNTPATPAARPAAVGDRPATAAATPAARPAAVRDRPATAAATPAAVGDRPATPAAAVGDRPATAAATPAATAAAVGDRPATPAAAVGDRPATAAAARPASSEEWTDVTRRRGKRRIETVPGS